MILDLNGKWALRWHDGDRGTREVKALEDPADQRRAIPATVPGAVHLDLMRAGIIQDPHDGLNVLECRWVEERFWFYRRTFKAPALRKGQQAFLVFEGLDLAAEIHLNGKQVGTHANSFYPCRLDVTASLAKGENVLVVKLDSGLFHAARRGARDVPRRSGHVHEQNLRLARLPGFGWRPQTGRQLLRPLPRSALHDPVAVAHAPADSVCGEQIGPLDVIVSQ